MDYFTYLNGTAKDELDDLDWIIGKFRIMRSKVTIEAHHNDTINKSINASIDQSQWPSEDWENFKECFGNNLPRGLVKFIEGTRRENSLLLTLKMGSELGYYMMWMAGRKLSWQRTEMV